MSGSEEIVVEAGGLAGDRRFLPVQISPRAFAYGVAASVGIGVALAGATLAREPLWNDEIASVALVSRPFGSLLSEFASTHSVGMLFHIALWPVVALGGVSSGWLRLPSLLAFAAAIVVCGLVGARLGGRAVGLCAALFLAVCPFAVLYGQEARMYAFALLFSLVAFWCLLRALELPGRGRWAAYAVAVAAVGYSHEFALLTLIGHLPLVLAAPRREGRREFALALGGAALLLAPLAFVVARIYGSDPLYWVSKPGFQTISDTVLLFAGSRAGVALCAVVIGVGVAVELLRRRSAGPAEPHVPPGVPMALLLWLVVPFAVLFVVSQAKPILVPRYVVPSAAAACLALALSVGILRRPLALAGALAVAAVLVYGSVQNGRELTRPDWPGVASWLEDRRADDQRIVFVGGQRNTAAFLYYAHGFGVKRDELPWTEAELAELPDSIAIIDKDNDVEDLSGALAEAPAWVVEQGTLPAETQQGFDQYLASCESTTQMVFRGISVRLLSECPVAAARTD